MSSLLDPRQEIWFKYLPQYIKDLTTLNDYNVQDVQPSNTTHVQAILDAQGKPCIEMYRKITIDFVHKTGIYLPVCLAFTATTNEPIDSKQLDDWLKNHAYLCSIEAICSPKAEQPEQPRTMMTGLTNYQVAQTQYFNSIYPDIRLNETLLTNLILLGIEQNRTIFNRIIKEWVHALDN